MKSRTRVTTHDNAPSAAFEVTEAEALIVAIDGQAIWTEDDSWLVRVVGIHTDRRRYWLQVLFVGVEQVAGTFEVDPSRPGEVLATLADWVGKPALDKPIVAARPASSCYC